MSNQIIEIAIRAPKSNIKEADFIAAKNAAVKSLISIKGIGPEREFEPFQIMPEKSAKVFIGMTRYESRMKTYQAMVSFNVLRNLMPFMGMMDNMAGIFLKPEDPNFDYGNFANKNNITEIALLRPRTGVSKGEFLQARTKFLSAMDAEPEVKQSYTFTVAGGFKNTDTFPHFTVYKSKSDFDRLMARARGLTFIDDFFKVFEAEIICFCTTIK
jgi:hypothetical protein